MDGSNSNKAFQVTKGNSLLVTDTCRFAFPSAITSSTSSGLETKRSVAPCEI